MKFVIEGAGEVERLRFIGDVDGEFGLEDSAVICLIIVVVVAASDGRGFGVIDGFKGLSIGVRRFTVDEEERLVSIVFFDCFFGVSIKTREEEGRGTHRRR